MGEHDGFQRVPRQFRRVNMNGFSGKNRPDFTVERNTRHRQKTSVFTVKAAIYLSMQDFFPLHLPYSPPPHTKFTFLVVRASTGYGLVCAATNQQTRPLARKDPQCANALYNILRKFRDRVTTLKVRGES